MPKLPGPEDSPLFPPAPDPRAEHRRRVGERLAELAARDGASFVSTRLARLARRFTEGLDEARNQPGDTALAGRLDARLRADLEAAAEGAPSPEAEAGLRQRGEILLAGAFQKAAIAQEFALQSEQRSGLAQAFADLRETARLAPHDYASLAEQLRQTIEGAALLLRPETVAMLKEAEPARLAEAAVKGLIEGGAPEAAREGLKSGAFDLGGARVALPLEREQVKGLTRLARAAERDAKARTRQEEASLRAEEAAGVGRRALELALAVGRGAAGLTEIEEAASDGVITAGKHTALEGMIAARQAEAETQAKRAERVAATVSGDGKALDPSDPEHRQAVEEAFAAILSESADLEPEAFAAQAAHFAGATGIVPERLVTRVSAGLRSQDPQIQADAARLLKVMTDAAPDGLSANGNDFMPAQVAQANALVRYLDAGIAAPEAARLAEEDLRAAMTDGVASADGDVANPFIRLASYKRDAETDGAAGGDEVSREPLQGVLSDKVGDIDVVEAEDGDGLILVNAETGEPIVDDDGAPARVSQDQLDHFDAVAEKLAEARAQGDEVDEDLAQEIGLLVLELAPGTGHVLSAAEAVEAFTAAYEAFEKDELGEALEQGGLGLLAAIGVVPGLGLLARLPRVGVKVARLFVRLLARGGTKATRKADDVINPNKIAAGERVKRGDLAEVPTPKLQSKLEQVRELRRKGPPGKGDVTRGERTLQLEINKRNGNAFERRSIKSEIDAGFNIGPKQRVQTSYGGREFDWTYLDKPGGKVIGFGEAKAGAGRQPRLQRLKDEEIRRGGTPVKVIRESDVK